jgi:hypothetical protein
VWQYKNVYTPTKFHIYFHENNIRVSHCCLAPNKQYYIYIMLRTIYICWDDNDVHFVLDR